ncbi:MAG: acetylglutamate kinase [Marinilabiliaceae bacterium]|nr:acetylglutamate kinase [Marinilabiliaceae bacterium]
MSDRLTIVKVGGKVVEEPQSLATLLDDFSKIAGHKILVHGGGRSATAMANRLGLESTMVDGRRITDQAMLEVVTMVYGGLVNKNIVAQLQARHSQAMGLTGADLDLIRAVKRPVDQIDYGFAGDVTSVNTKLVEELIRNGVVPVIAPLTHDGKGQLLNTNADTMASEMASAFARTFRVQLIYCFEKRGVLADPHNDESVIRVLDRSSFNEYKETGVISEGMIPKLDNGFNALANGVTEVIITNTENIRNGGTGGTRLMLT